ncbi:MAG TPA: signal peptidase I [Acidimicrobiales bacterium]
MRASRARRACRALAALATGTALGVAIVTATLIVAPMALGWRSLTVMSGSMEPTIATADIVVTRPVDASAVRPGTVITFQDPAGDGRLITHRVRRATLDGDSVHVITQGDANESVERWTIATTGRVGVVQYRIPAVGVLLRPAASPAGRLLLVGVPLLLLGLMSLRAIWRAEPEAQIDGDTIVAGAHA